MSLKETIVRQLGLRPSEVSLDVSVLSEETAEGGRRLLLEYVVEPGERTEAYLLVPEDLDEKSPAVVAIHQDGPLEHLKYGKAEPAGIAGDPEMAYGIELMRRGYVVLCPDRRLRGKRLPTDENLREAWGWMQEWVSPWWDLAVKSELDWHDCRLLMQGRTAFGKQISELICAVDYLQSLDEVDDGRIGAIGHSAGGLYAAWLMFADERVKVGYSSCGVALLSSWLADPTPPKASPRPGCVVPGQLGAWDMDDVLALLAPRPFMESRGARDYRREQDKAETESGRLYSKALARYREVGAEDRFRTHAFPGAHEFPRQVRELGYQWMDRWLKDCLAC